MHWTRTAVAITAAAVSPLAFAVLGVSGTAMADGPQVDDCANAMVITGGISAKEAKSVCTHASKNKKGQLDDCVNALVITGGPSAKNPKKVCTGPDAGDLTDGD